MDDAAALRLIEEEMSLPDGTPMGRAFTSDPWQRDSILRPCLATDERGLPLHRNIYIELSRGCGKTHLVGILATVEALRGDGTHCFAVAKDAQQAGILLDSIKGQIYRNARLGRLFTVTREEVRCASTQSFIRVMSSDVPSFYGLGASARRIRLLLDELCQWPERGLFDAATSTLPKCTDSQMVIISNAGLEGTWQQEVRVAAEADGYYLYTTPDVPASWVSKEDLARAEQTLPPEVYNRYYRNKWVKSTGGFVSLAAWDACAVRLPRLDAKTPVVVGADAAVSGDCFALVAVTRAPERHADAVAVRAVRVWAPERGRSIDFQEPWDWLAEFVGAHSVVEITYDPYQLHDMMSRFNRKYGVWCVPFDQGIARAIADSALFSLIREKRLLHGGDPILREHVSNAAFHMSAREDTKGRLVKAAPRRKIDALVALSMAASEALRLYL